MQICFFCGPGCLNQISAQNSRKKFPTFFEGRYDFPYEIKKDAQEKITRNREEIGQFISNIFGLEGKMLKL